MEKINLVELLKDCPKGMELDCTMFADTKIYKIDDSTENEYPIRIEAKNGFLLDLTKYGTYVDVEEAKCVIFPKGKTTWEGFVPPSEFKDGDILTTSLGSIFVLKEPSEKEYYYSCYVALNDLACIVKSYTPFCVKEGCRYATEKEKETLFQAIKDNGYKWNDETKTLEKLVEPKFKVGDKIVKKNSVCVPMWITSVGDEFYYSDTKSSVRILSISEQDDWTLVSNTFDINTLKPFESRVLVRDKNNDEWRGQFFSHYYNNSDRPYICIGVAGLCEYKQCIPYKGNEHLLGKTDDCGEFYKTW